ncbi:Transposase [Lentibacillus halodurans]|uniref:Transposase n=1 Tax=Lentibacillus halodurans TaxID=237679 RepID=A0A1I0Y075_9BACI|nr:ISL3 family transposase [Lentibacillus halodurans]SFB06056.1 Transposase [Lentibacillus halodurans]
MNSNISLPGLEACIITESFNSEGYYQLHVKLERKPHSCPRCGQWTDQVHEYRPQKIKHTQIFSRRTKLIYRKRRYVCGDCKKRFYEDNSIVERYQRQSIEFKQAIGIELINGKNFKDVAARFDTSPTTVMRRFDQISFSMLSETKQLPEVIAIDEYKGDTGGEKYQTVIADPIERRPLDILKDRKKETVKEYLRQHGDNVKVVVMDMSHSFKAAVDQALGGPVVVADRFHFCRYIYWALERVRRKVQNDFDDYDRKKCKRMRHVFYKHYENLTDRQLWYLNYYLEKSDKLKNAYQLKEAYRLWFKTAKRLAPNGLKEIKERHYQYYDLVKSSGIKEFEKVIETFQNWQKEIMNSFGLDLHNGFVEGINNQTKVIKRNAFGFKRFDRFRLKILLHHQYKHFKVRVA